MGHHTHRQQCAEPVAGVERDPEAPQYQHGEDQHDNARADQPQLLADHGKDEVVVLLRQVQELLPSPAQSHAQKAARADGDQALRQLVAVAVVVLPRVVPHLDTGRAVSDDARLRQLDEQKAQCADAADAHRHPPALYAAHDHQHRAGGEDQNGARQVRLQHHQHADDRQQRHIGQYALPPRQHLLPLFRYGVGEVHDDRQLGDLRRLELEHALDAQPSGGSVGGDGQRVVGDNDQYQQEQRQPHQQPSRAAPALIVDLADDEHGHKTQRREGGLPLEVVGAVPGVVIGPGKAGGKQHDQADDRQQQRQDQEGEIHLPAGGFLMPALHLPHPFLLGLPGALFLPCHSLPPSL